MTVLAAFAAVHERVIEFIRSFNQRFLASRIALVRNIAQWIDVATTDYRNIVFALVLAVATRADLLALFQYNNSNHARAEAASRTSVPKLPPSEIPPAGFLTALSGIAGTATRRVPPPTQPPA